MSAIQKTASAAKNPWVGVILALIALTTSYIEMKKSSNQQAGEIEARQTRLMMETVASDKDIHDAMQEVLDICNRAHDEVVGRLNRVEDALYTESPTLELFVGESPEEDPTEVLEEMEELPIPPRIQEGRIQFRDFEPIPDL